MQAKKIKDLSLIVDSISIGGRVIQPRRIFCIGKNYAEHIRESDNFDAKLQTKKEKHPVVFMKPVTSIVSLGESIHVPTHGKILHHEVEVVVLLNGGGKNILIENSLSCIAGVTLGLDLTLRDVQVEVKKKGHPWELSKSFDQSSPLGLMRSYDDSFDLFDIPFACFVNEEKRQEGNTKDMIFSIPQTISFLSTVWKLMPGDLIYTGTPSGIGVIKSRDEIILNSPILGRFAWTVF
jgi:2-keto-4-pentenoate hydratase/2-oxohepta-3-ene-1,7-dioic acid hydratase in catechol pathway